ncbi:MAG: hypothetical protein LBS36_12285 [Oscillospiraceae bacterium]|jgi:hypothetical protein|nr:hypothetical protein [Oscillospiraceae bacterium]
MACLLVPAAEAVIVTAVAYAIKSREKKAMGFQGAAGSQNTGGQAKILFSSKLMWLARLLWGGAFLLVFEHVWHGEIVPWFPFLTAAGNPQDAAVMLHELATVGVTMAVLVTLVWVGVVLVVGSMEKKERQSKVAA